MSEIYALKMEGVVKNYSGRAVLDGLNLCVKKGGSVSLFGENGSGKTSLLKIASSLVKPSAGKVNVAGFDTVASAENVRKKVGFVSHEDCLYESLSAFDNLKFFCELHRVENPAQRTGELIESFEIASASVPSGDLSAGMKKRVSIARAVSHNPEVLLLDEPFSGLDRKGTAIFSNLLQHLRQTGTTVLAATHLIDEGLVFSDFAAFLSRGRIPFYESTSGMTPAVLEREFEKFSRDKKSIITARETP